MTGRYLASVGSFAAKGLCAFLITWRLGNALSVSDFALWGTLFSFGMILSVADFGVGQLVLTTLHEEERAHAGNPRLMASAVLTMLLLGAVVLVLTAILIGYRDLLAGIRWRYLVVAVILLRLVFIPAGAALSAQERYHERKVAEAAAYVTAAVFVFWATARGASLSTLLLGVNLLITFGSAAIWVRALQLGVGRVEPGLVTGREVVTLFRDAWPYFINNVSGLVIYGGFIALSSLVLAPADLARLSLLHGLLFMHLYQVFELVFRTVQVRLDQPAMMPRLTALLGLSSVIGVVLAGAAGVWLFRQLFGKYPYTPAELMVYTAFVFLEVYYLLLTSALQMRRAARGVLQSLSLAKAGAFLALLGVLWVLPNRATLLGYSGLLTAFSLVLTGAMRAASRRGVAA